MAAIALDTAWADRDENLYVASVLARRLPADTDLIVLPELFTTGFVTDPAVLTGIADSDSLHPGLDAMRKMAAELNAAVCGSIAWMLDDGKFVNRCLFVEPNGETTHYDKHHLFILGQEPETFKPGTAEPPVVRFRGWNICMVVCYDLRFPEWLRNRGARYDLLVIPANWPQARAYAWEHLLIARAIENQAFVIGANRSGTDDNGRYDGLSHIYDYLGMPMDTDVRDDMPAVAAWLSHKALDDARRGFPVLQGV